MKQQYDSYKPSGIDWIGDIPSPWQIVRIKNIISLLTDYDANGSFSDIASNCKINEGIPYAWMVRATDLENKRYGIVEGNNYCDISTYYYLSKSSLVKDDILIAKRGDIGKSYLVPNCDSPMTLAPNTYLLKTLKNLINNRYFFYYLQSSSGKESLRLENKSTTLGALYKDDVKRIPIPLPPLAEQEVIAEWLDEKCGEIDAAIAKVDREIELIDELKQSEISRVVTRGLNPDAPMRPSGIDWIGDIPEHWTQSRIKNHISRSAAGVWGDDEKGNKNDIICFRIADFNYGERCLSFDKITIRNIDPKQLEGRYLSKGDLLIEKSGGGETTPVGRVVYCNFDGKATYTNFIHSITLSDNVDSRFFLYYFNMLYSNKINLLYFNQTTGLQNLQIGEYLGQAIYLPPLSEQQAIADFLDKKCAEIDGLKEKLSKKRETLKELRQSIISEVVTGKRKVI